MAAALTLLGMVVGSLLFGLYCIGVMISFLDRVDEERPVIVCIALALCWPIHLWVVHDQACEPFKPDKVASNK